MEAGQRIAFDKEKVDWIHLEFVTAETAQLVFFYGEELVIIHYRFSDSKVFLSQRFHSNEIKDKTSHGILKDGVVYFISKKGYANTIQLIQD